MFINGLWALNAADTVVDRFKNTLLLTGPVVATVQAITAFFWLFTPYWPGALVIIAIDMLVIYALLLYGERDDVYV